MKAAQNQQYPIRLVKNGQVLLVAEPTGGELVLTVIDLASGRRDLWARIADGHPSRHNQLFAATPDVKYYAYPFPRFSSVLYAVQNLH